MTIAEGVQGSLRYKPYSSGAITSNAQPDKASEPGSSGGQVMRRVSASLNLTKDTFTSSEIRTDRMVGDLRHGVRRVAGSVSGELSPATWFEMFEAAHRHTAVASINDSNIEFTSAAADNVLSTITFAGGDPVSEGYGVGEIVRLANMSDVDNNARNFVIVGFGGTSNRTLTVFPAPDTMSADTAFTITRPGKVTFPPATGHVSRKFFFEHYQSDIDYSRLFKECRIAGYRISAPATGMVTVDVTVLGRDMEIVSAGSAPFFASPTAATSTNILASVNGALYINGTRAAVVTGFDITYAMAAEAPAVVGQSFVPEIFLGRSMVSGTFSAYVEDAGLFNLFLNETEATFLAMLEAETTQPAAAMSIYLPAIKVTAADLNLSGEGGQLVTIPFVGLRYEGSGAGIESTAIQIHDTSA